jgi:hypothetical protein
MLSLATPETISPPNPIRESFSSRIRWPRNCMNSSGDELPKEEVVDHHDHALRQISNFDSKNNLTHQRIEKASDASCFFMCCRLLLCSCAIVHVSDYQACAKGEVSKLKFHVPKRPFTDERIHAEHLLSNNLVRRPQDSASSPSHFFLRGAGYWLSDGREDCDTAVFFIFQSNSNCRLSKHLGDHPKIPSRLRANAFTATNALTSYHFMNSRPLI